MVEQQRQRVEQEMTKMINELDKTYLRKIQKEMHKCAGNCCDKDNLSVEQVQQCIERCSVPLNKAQNYVQQEMEHTQNRLQRCIMQCNDEIRDKMGVGQPSDKDIDRYTGMFEKCAVKCVDNHIQLIPSLLKSMKSVLAKGMPESL